MTNQPQFLTTARAAERIGLSASTLEKARVRGDGPEFLRVGRRRIVYDPATLDAWARSQQFRSTSEYGLRYAA